ncbi:MAG: hypothetical protein M3O61_15085 [Gemmatimonadota bacterium]|nr:hypothetical protein [Gemmatimonadota bacterium]
MRAPIVLVAFSLALARPYPVNGQSLEPVPVACKGQAISRIEIHTRPPFEITGSQLQQRLARQVTALHATTTSEIIRRFLALEPGEPCTELRRSESERILRAQPYLAAASVLAFPDENGKVAISVVTVDEVSLIFGGGASGKPPHLRKFRLGEANLMGQAISLDGDWRYNSDFPDAFVIHFVDYQVLGKPYQLHADFGRRERGADWGVEASHPFLTDLQRVSWRTNVGSRDSYSRFRRLDGQYFYLPFKRTYGDIGGVVRIGPPGRRLALVGASASYEEELPGSTPIQLEVSSREFVPVDDTPLSNRYSPTRVTRINALFGLRDVRFVQVSGFETLDGLQDVRKGSEIGTLVGRGIEAFGGGGDDMFVSTDFYMGFGSPRAFAGMEVLAEGRKPESEDEWDGILASGRAVGFVKPEPRHTLVAAVEWSAGWRQRIPFQLSLADRDGGLAGYRRSTLAGARRLVTRVEDRIYLGRLKQFASIGIAPFVHTGKLWAGDAPFGTTAGVRWSAGVGLLASVPPGSQRLWRLDLAFPIPKDYGAKWQVRLTGYNFTRMFWKEPSDVARNRERAIPTSIFNWP